MSRRPSPLPVSGRSLPDARESRLGCAAEARADGRVFVPPGLRQAPVLDLMCSHFVLSLAARQGHHFNVRRDLNTLLSLAGRHLVWPAPVLARLRAGAEHWQWSALPGNPEALRETFRVPSWLAYLRLEERLTQSDRQLEKELEKLAGAPPLLRHSVIDGD